MCYSLRVTANGRAQRGAAVRIAGHSARTSRTGRARICVALSAGYHTASATVRGLGTVRGRFLVHASRAAPAPPRFTG